MTIAVNYAAVEVAQQQVSAVLGRYMASLDNMHTALRPVFDAWQSSGNDAFIAKKTRWTQTFEELKRIGDTMQAHLVTSGENYSSTDQRVGNLFA
jgi:WXG100 family type VII secretion target